MPLRIQLYAVRHKPSGYYLPAPQGKGGRGGTWVTPKAFIANHGTNRHTLIPRLWATPRAANCALSLWLKGKQSWSWVNEEGYQEYNGTIPDKHRRAEEWEVVEAWLELS